MATPEPAAERTIHVMALPVNDAATTLLAAYADEVDGIDYTLTEPGPSRAAELAVRERLDAALVAADGDCTGTIAVVARLRRARPDMPIVVLAPLAPASFVGEALAAGAEDVMIGSEPPDEVALALHKACARRSRDRAAAAGQPDGRLIAIVGPKGGSGKTLTATNLGCALAAEGRHTLLIDLDLEFGDCAIVLGLSPERTIYDLVNGPGMLDEEKLAGYVTQHAASGLDVLIGPTRPDQADAVTAERIAGVFAVARRLYEFIVVDSAPAFSPVVIATVDGADEVVLLASMDVPSLKDARLGLDTLELMGRGRDDVRVVVNRASSKGGLAVARASEALGRKVDVVIPYDAAVPRSYNEGAPLVVKNRRNGVSKAIHELRKAVAAAHATPSSHHNLARLMGRS